MDTKITARKTVIVHGPEATVRGLRAEWMERGMLQLFLYADTEKRTDYFALIRQMTRDYANETLLVCATGDEETFTDCARRAPDGALFCLYAEVDRAARLCKKIALMQPECLLVCLYDGLRDVPALMHLHLFDLLEAPLRQDSMKACLEAAIRREMIARMRGRVSLPVPGGQTYVELGQIYYFHKSGAYITAYTQAGNYVWRGGLVELLARLPAGFAQINRQDVVNLRQIALMQWEEERLTLSCGIKLSVARRRKSGLQFYF